MSSLDNLKPKFSKVIEHLKGELGSLRSGRATPLLVENVAVEAYGTTTPLKELASINTPEPRLLIISPWDKGIIKDVEKALQVVNLGASPVIDGAVIRINLPPLSEERRKELVKILNTKLEEARIGVRSVREDSLKDFKQQKSNGDVSEDEFFVVQKDMQKIVDDFSTQIKKIGEDKEKEIMTI